MLISVDRAGIWFYVNFVMQQALSVFSYQNGTAVSIVFINSSFHQCSFPELMSAIVRKKHCSINEANCVGYACTQATFRQIAESRSLLSVRRVFLICYSY